MTGLRIAFLFVAVVAGDYAALMLIDCQLINFGIAATICAASSVAAGLMAHANDERTRRHRELGGRHRKAERHDHQAATAADRQCALCGDVRQKLDDSAKFVGPQGARLCSACALAANSEPTR
jgi:hypothetical protein